MTLTKAQKRALKRAFCSQDGLYTPNFFFYFYQFLRLFTEYLSSLAILTVDENSQEKWKKALTESMKVREEDRMFDIPSTSGLSSSSKLASTRNFYVSTDLFLLLQGSLFQEGEIGSF